MCTSQTRNKEDICSDTPFLNNHFPLFVFLFSVCTGKGHSSAFCLSFIFFYFPPILHLSLHLPFSLPDRCLLCNQGWPQTHNPLALPLSPLLRLQPMPSCAAKSILFQVDLFRKVFLGLQRKAKRGQNKIS